MGTGHGPRSLARRGHRARLVVAIGVAALALATIVPVTFGTVGFRDRFHDEFSFSHEDCGWTVNVDVEINGDFFVRIGKGEFETAFFGHNNFDWTETHVRESDGATIVLSANLMFVETKAVHLEDNLYQFTAVTAGQFIVIRDASGTIIGRDRGMIVEDVIFDTLGDDTPGGEYIEQVSIRFNGQYPSEFIDYCSLFDA